MTLNLPPHSMFMATPAYQVGDAVMFGLRRRVMLPDSTDVIYEVPPAADCRLWLVSELFFGTQNLWWVIAELNNLSDPLAGVRAGDRLRIPTRERLSDAGVFNS